MINFTDQLLEILKKYIPNIDIQNPIIKYLIDKFKIKISDISDLLIPLKSIFQINNCKNNFIKCLKEIYTLHLKYSDVLDKTSKCIKIDLTSAISIPKIESFVVYLFLLDNDFAIMRFTNYKEDDSEEDTEYTGKLSNLTHYLIRTKNAFEIDLSCFLFLFLFNSSSDNSIESSGAQALASALQYNSSLLSLNLKSFLCFLSIFFRE